MKKFRIVLLTLVLFFSCFISFMPSSNILSVSASNIQIDGAYTSVLEDLQKDKNFKTENYSVIENDYSLQVIQIAESNENELFVYVYQPSANYANLKASSINISCALHKKASIKNYKLTLLNSSGVFYKYKVIGLAKQTATTRYYEVVSIFRPWNSMYDEQASGGNIITEVSFEVAKQFTFVDIDGETHMNCSDTEVITITNKYVGFMRYRETTTPEWLHKNYVDSHFVAFSTDRDIDNLYEADVYYVSQYVHREGYNVYTDDFATTEYGSKKENYAYLDYTQHETVEGDYKWWEDGLLWDGINYSFDRIQSVNDFISSEDRSNMYSNPIFDTTAQSKITDQGLQDLKGMQWVLRFAETDYEYDVDTDYVNLMGFENYTIVGEVTILRLKFETNHKVYDMAVVDNKQSGDGIPDNETTIDYELNDVFKIILMILLLIVLLIVLNPILPLIFKVIGWIITAPFKFIGWIIGLFKNSKKK